MLALAFRFPAGRYHANPWGRHVNEAEVAWPPEPWRILRGLIAVWHRKVEAARYPEALLESLVRRLSSELPHYHLPPATAAHTRHYMPSREGVREKKVLIFDAFARVDAERPLMVLWPEMVLPEREQELLDLLLSGIGYLGRAESWVEAERVDGWRGEPNCLPGDGTLDPATGELFDRVELLAPWDAATYAAWRQGFLEGEALHGMRGRKAELLRASVPERLLDALRLDTADWQRSGWSRPPGARTVGYLRLPDCFVAPSSEPPRRPLRSGGEPTTVRLILTGKPQPRIEDAVRVGELARLAITSQARWLFGPDRVPAVLSGHGMPEGNLHGHAFYLPEDADGDGHIDHLLIHAPAGLCPESRRAVERLRMLYLQSSAARDEEREEAGELPKREEWRVFVERMGWTRDFEGDDGSLLVSKGSRVWRSVTPYLHPWFEKPGFGIEEQLRRECGLRDIGELVGVEWLPTVEIRGKARRALDFHRFRAKRGLNQPDRRGQLLRLTFREPVQGPLALGFGCHYGLGVFVPEG